MRGIIYIHPESEQRQPLIAQFLCTRPRRHSGLPPLRQPCEHAGVTRRVPLVNRAQGLASAPHDVVRNPTALSSIGRAAKAAPLIDDDAISCHRAIPVMLGELPPKVLIEGCDVDRPDLHWAGAR